MQRHTHRPYRSLFWPIILIGIGFLWLLNNLGAIAQVNLPIVFRLWPLLLIFVGLDILLGRRSPVFGALLGILAILMVAGFMISGRALGLSPNVEVKNQNFTSPIGEATSANLLLSFSDNPVTVQALSSDSQYLIDATLRYVGKIDFHVSGTSTKSVTLARNEADFLLFSPLYWDPSLNWQIGLTTKIPLDLRIDGGSGESQVNLSNLMLDRLRVAMGSGSSHFIAPQVSKPLKVEVGGGSGAMSWVIPEEVLLTMQLSGGSGSVSIQLPTAPAVRLEIQDEGTGKVTFPTTWVQVTKAAREAQGTWESPGYSQASHKIIIIITHVGSGNIRIG